ncbi:MAG: metalloregulator ArsR/SmtB family transcription factor [Acidimicrobiia bacterium]
MLLDFYKALADRSRLEIIGLLSRRPASVGELAELLNLREATVSHHLGRLRKVGLVTATADGTTRRYSLDSARLDEMSRAILATRPEEVARAEEHDAAVMRSFVHGERLAEIPAKRSKRDVILHWLVERFPPGERMGESEVNDLISRAHEDTAWLRRELVGAGLLRRERGVYWRPR